MAEWCLSGSDSDEAGGRETSDKDEVDLGSLKLPYSTVLDLMKVRMCMDSHWIIVYLLYHANLLLSMFPVI